MKRQKESPGLKSENIIAASCAGVREDILGNFSCVESASENLPPGVKYLGSPKQVGDRLDVAFHKNCIEETIQ